MMCNSDSRMNGPQRAACFSKGLKFLQGGNIAEVHRHFLLYCIHGFSPVGPSVFGNPILLFDVSMKKPTCRSECAQSGFLVSIHVYFLCVTETQITASKYMFVVK